MTIVFDFEFNDAADLADWTVISGNAGYVGIENGILKIGNDVTATNNRIMLAHNTLIPFNPALLYHSVVRCWRSVAGLGGISVGYIGYAADGTTVISTALDGNVLQFHAHAVFELITVNEPGRDFTIPETWANRTLGHSTVNGGMGEWGNRMTEVDEQWYFENGYALNSLVSVGVAYLRPVIYCNYQFAFSGSERVGIWNIDRFYLEYMDYDLLYDDPSSVYSATPSTTSLARGSSLTVDVTVTNATDGTLFYEVVSTSPGCDVYDFYDYSTSSLPNGNFYVASGVGSFSINTGTALAYDDGTPDTFKVVVRKQSRLGDIVVETPNITLSLIPTKFDLVRSRAEVSEIYTPPTPIYDNLGNIVAFIDGASVITIRVYCNQKPVGTAVPFEMTGIQAADIQEMRINNVVVPVSLTGSFSLIQYIGDKNYSDLRLIMAEDGLTEPTERCTLTLQDPGGTLNMITPHPSIYFDIVGYEILDDYGLQTFSPSGQLVFSADVMSFLTVQRGTVTVSNTLSNGNTTQDVYVTGLVADENWIVSLHLPAFDVSYKIWADVYTGFFRINFTRDTALGTPPSSVVMSYSVLRV